MSRTFRPWSRRRLGIAVGIGMLASIVVPVIVLNVTRDDAMDEPTIEETRPVVVTGDPLPKQVGGDDAAIGTVLPVIDGQSFDGTPVHIGPGRRTLIVFTAHWKDAARDNITALAAYAKTGATPGFDIVVISTEAKPDQPSYPPSKQFADAAAPDSYPYPVLADSADNAAATALGFKTFPWIIMYDEQGRLVFRFPLSIDSTFMNEQAPQIFDDPGG